jgi:predicted lipoprotein with Yx(FWY)xxD motif
MRRPLIAALGVIIVAALIAACGGSSNSSSSGAGTQSSGSAGSQSSSKGTRYGYGGDKTTSSASGATTVATRHLSDGTVLVGANGRTLYLFEKDKGAASACSGACAKGWPPLTAKDMPKAGAGVNASMLTLIKRPDGTRQVAYHGHPLYYFVGDKQAGQDTGQGLEAFGADWYVVAPNGSKIDDD